MKNTTKCANSTHPRVIWLLYTESGALFSWFNSYSMANACLAILEAGTIVRKQVEAKFNGF